VSNTANGHDIVVVGASAGGVEALRRMVGGLPPDFAAAVFVVLHLPPNAPSALATILNRSGPVPASQVEHKQPIEPGRIYVARPNRHLVLRRGHVALEAGPRENSARPSDSVDVLFRSAARAYGRRVVGIVLSGTLRDGAQGLAAVKLRGGITMVQDPDEALFAGMPESARSSTEIDYCLAAADIPTCLVELTQHAFEQERMQPSEPKQPEPTMRAISLSACCTSRTGFPHRGRLHAADEPDGQFSPKLPNAASGLTCPECNGSLWELKEGSSLRYECRIGHTYSVDALLGEQGETVEAALWSAVNAMQERAATFRRLAGAAAIRSTGSAYGECAELIEGHAEALLKLLRGLIADGEVG
jgi:two-component system, chemotaxis family, protein-glutamate methylesterase/glutaminase